MRNCDVIAGQTHSLGLGSERGYRAQTSDVALWDTVFCKREDVVLYDKCNGLVRGTSVN